MLRLILVAALAVAASWALLVVLAARLPPVRRMTDVPVDDGSGEG